MQRCAYSLWNLWPPGLSSFSCEMCRKNTLQLPIPRTMLSQTFYLSLRSHRPIPGLLSMETTHTDRRENSNTERSSKQGWRFQVRFHLKSGDLEILGHFENLIPVFDPLILYPNLPPGGTLDFIASYTCSPQVRPPPTGMLGKLLLWTQLGA